MFDSTPTTQLDVETLDELRHYVQRGRDDFRAEIAHGTHTAQELAEAERRWQQIQWLLASLEVEAHGFPTNARGYVLCFRIMRGSKGSADANQYPTIEAATAALGEYSPAQQGFEQLRVVRTMYVSPSGRPMRKEPSIP